MNTRYKEHILPNFKGLDLPVYTSPLKCYCTFDGNRLNSKLITKFLHKFLFRP